jgi:hypothetical protein
MTGVFAGRSGSGSNRRHRSAALIALGLAWAAQPAPAVEFADGRVQIHGFGEMQVRALNEKFKEELDLAQWYNVINLEFEFDIAPDGVGPFDLVSAYVRAEGRYDAIYSDGFGMFPSINTFGDDAERLPERLRDAVDKEYSGTIEATDRDRTGPRQPGDPEVRIGKFSARRIQDKKPAPLKPVGERQGFPGMDTFFRQLGPDNVSGVNPDENLGTVKLGQASDDPAAYVHEKVLGFKFAFKEVRGPSVTDTQILGPWLPKNFIRSVALNTDRGNPFRGRVAPSAARSGFGATVDEVRFYEGDPFLPGLAEGESLVIDRLDPLLDQILNAPDSVLTNIGQVVLNTTFPTGLFQTPRGTTPFGGDFLGGTVPCVDATNSDFQAIRDGTSAPPGPADCIRGATDRVALGGTGELYTDPNILGITKMVGGTAEAPFKPAPDLANLGRVIVEAVEDPNNPGQVITVVREAPDSRRRNLEVAQGLYVPSKGLVKELRSGDLDSLNFNFDETDRSWNRGDSQERNKEIKEAYADLELLDSRLWMRLGLQNIVWGKTELFRTTDQFNPQDLALASLPSLEESRIALWSARFVYSLYNIGPVEDVRLEFAANIDQYQPSDLGACGEPFTPDIVCALTNGIFAHSLLGIGVAGIDRPESPWKEPSDLEVGGRIEWRWDRFSFALTNFYGFSDFPHADAIFFYERAVDHDSGRPLVARLPGGSLGKCGVANAGEVAELIFGLRYSTSFASHRLSVTPGAVTNQDGLVRGGIGRDQDCLRPGGARGEANQFSFDEAEDDLDNTNALANHHANQQIFAWICAGTVGIAASLDASSCAWTIFASEAVLSRQFLPIPFIEVLTPVLAGEQTGGNGGPQQFLSLTQNAQKFPAADVTAPLAPLNRLQNNPFSPIFDRNGDGALNAVGCDDPDPDVRYNCDLSRFDGFDSRVANFPQFREFVPTTLDNSLTNEQRALLGCGPFYGSRCDSALDSGVYGKFGGVDFLNMEGSVLVQSWPGVEGTVGGDGCRAGDDIDLSDCWLTTAAVPVRGVEKAGALNQPGTVGFVGGAACTRFVSGEGTVKLPGCRGVESLLVTGTGSNRAIEIVFETGYLPSIDGCVIGDQVFDSANDRFVPVSASYSGKLSDETLSGELALCSKAKTRHPQPRDSLLGFETLPDGSQGAPIISGNPNCVGQPAGGQWDNLNHQLCIADEVDLEMLPLIHPIAGCVESDVWFENGGNGDGGCEYFYERDLTEELFQGTAALFQNELAAFSWNFLMFLTVTSCNATAFDLDGLKHTTPQFANAQEGLRDDPQCFDAENPWQPGRCSYATPNFCGNVKGFLSAAGVTRNTQRAGGNGAYGRRTFIWHSGGEVVLRYEQRNVFGFSTDFGEDFTKTNWGMEFTWIDDVPFTDNDEALGVSRSDVYNLTVSVDRPTFINFLNPNRTFFFNSQWFFNYIPDHGSGYTFNGPVNVLFTFAMFTGYFQDRVNPQFVTVYDFNSRSGGLLPSLQYRFTESFSVTVGLLYFFGRTELKDMPVQEFGPTSNRVGKNANKVGVDNLLSLIRKRDEVFLRLRWTF